MKTYKLAGGLLNYWTARAEGVPADQLRLQAVPRTDNVICVRGHAAHHSGSLSVYTVDYSRGDMALSLLANRVDTLHMLDGPDRRWVARVPSLAWGSGDVPMQAVCRAVVRSVFGDEVDEVVAC